MRSRFLPLFLLAGLATATVPMQARAQAPISQSQVAPGPRAAPDAPRVQYRLPGETGHENDAMRRDTHTFRLSTLALVLAVILLVVLIS